MHDQVLLSLWDKRDSYKVDKSICRSIIRSTNRAHWLSVGSMGLSFITAALMPGVSIFFPHFDKDAMIGVFITLGLGLWVLSAGYRVYEDHLVEQSPHAPKLMPEIFNLVEQVQPYYPHLPWKDIISNIHLNQQEGLYTKEFWSLMHDTLGVMKQHRAQALSASRVEVEPSNKEVDLPAPVRSSRQYHV